ncbi:MAG: PAS domain-containing protein [Desulfobacterales bacterium]|nr:PAS domain-containing protein [Desulfobacterales bacterium]
MALNIRVKIILISFVIFFLAMGANTLVSSIVFTREYSNILQSKGFVVAHMLKSQLDRLLKLKIPVGNLVGFEEQCQDVVSRFEEISYAMVLDTKGKILFHNDPLQHNRLIADTSISESIKRHQDTTLVCSVDGEQYCNIIVPVAGVNGNLVAAVIIGFPTILISGKTEEIITYSVGIAVFFFCIGTVLLIALLNIWVARPLDKLIRVTRQVAAGDLGAKAEISSNDELQELTESFNQMTQSLKKSQEELINARDYTANIISSMIDTLIVISPESRIETVNDSTCKLLNYTEDELLGQHFGTVVPAFQGVKLEEFETIEQELKALFVDPAFQETKLAELIEKGVVTNLDAYYRDKKGRKIPMSIVGSAMRDKHGNLSGAVLVARDMREIQRLIAELRAAHKFSESIVTTIPSGLAALDKKGRILFANPGFLKLFGNRDFIGKQFDEAVSIPELNRMTEKVLMQNKQIRNEELVHKKKDSELILSSSIVDLTLPGNGTTEPVTPKIHGRKARALVVFDDITEQKRLFRELEEKIREVRRTHAQLVESAKLASLGELAAGVAHEINNPLTAVLTYSVLLKENLEQTDKTILNQLPDFPEQLDLIKISAERCKSIANNLLIFSRQSETEMTLVNISDVISRTFDLIGVQLRRKQIRVVRRIQENIPMFPGNPSRLQQVFTNIVLNAVWVMDKGGELTICAKYDNRMCEVTISDTGPGIPRENLSRIFDPFFTTKPIGKGTGLGLSIVYGIIQDHHGEITAESALGQGATFYIRLPFAKKL